MSKKKNVGPQVDRAVPTIRQPKGKNSEKVALTASLGQTLKASPDWAQATAVQTAYGSLDQDAQKLAAIMAQVEGLRGQLRTALTLMGSTRRDWATSLRHLLGTVEVYSKGSVDVVKGFGFEVRATGTLGPSTAPSNLVLARGKAAGTVTAKWDAGTGHRKFVVQHATDPATPATFSTPQAWTRRTYTLGGLPSGSTVYVRVAEIDPTSASGLGPYCAWVAGTAR